MSAGEVTLDTEEVHTGYGGMTRHESAWVVSQHQQQPQQCSVPQLSGAGGSCLQQGQLTPTVCLCWGAAREMAGGCLCK